MLFLVAFLTLIGLGGAALGLFFVIKAPDLANPDTRGQGVGDYRGAGILCLVAAIIAVGVVVWCFSSDVLSSNSDDSDSKSSYAWTVATSEVEKKLKAPSTAEFCKSWEADITQNGDTWTVKGYVDAENSYGAMLRNYFTVVITFTSDTSYIIEQCSIN